MANHQDIWRLSEEERHSIREAGVNRAYAEHFEVDARDLDIVAAKNGENITMRGIFGFMEVKVEWTTPEGRWHMRNLRYDNNENPVNLAETYLAALGQAACSKPTDSRDYTKDAYGLPLREIAEPALTVIADQPVESPAEFTARPANEPVPTAA